MPEKKKQVFKMNRHNPLFRQYMRKLAIGLKSGDQHKIQEVKEFFKSKQLDISYNKESQKIRLIRIGAIPVSFTVAEFLPK